MGPDHPGYRPAKQKPWKRRQRLKSSRGTPRFAKKLIAIGTSIVLDRDGIFFIKYALSSRDYMENAEQVIVNVLIRYRSPQASTHRIVRPIKPDRGMDERFITPQIAFER